MKQCPSPELFDVFVANLRARAPRALIHQPIAGRILLALIRTSMRIVNAIPLLEDKMRDSRLRLRKIKDETPSDNRHS
jgi:hypothetical protein